LKMLHYIFQYPRVEDVLLEVPIESSRQRRAAKSEPSFEPLRIYLYYDKSVLELSSEKQLFVNVSAVKIYTHKGRKFSGFKYFRKRATLYLFSSSLLPEAAGFWENALRVARADGPIRLRRKCISSYYYFQNEKKTVACDRGCREWTTCGDAIIPQEHLLVSLLVTIFVKNVHIVCRRTTVTQPVLNEVEFYFSFRISLVYRDADFVLYVTAISTKRCDSVDTLAYAAHCQQEAVLDRPVAGHVNLCPSALSTHRHDREILLSTVKHEILHALGFSVGLYAFFRDEHGKPRTKRNRYGKPISLNKELGYYDWDRSTITTVLRQDWWTGNGRVVHPVHMVVTPRVVDEARRHFACDSLEGAELENQGGDGTALTHWEKRVFENEAMTGTHTQNPVYSRVTLALLEDSGWYKSNYEKAEELHWGRKLGCDFVKKSCGEWIKTKVDNEEMPTPFCNEIKHDGTKSLAVTRCTSQRDSLALCNLVPYKKELPVQFRNYAAINGVSEEGVKHYGGSVELADFCPYSQEFEWKLPNTTIRRDSRCELEGNNREGEDILEVYGTSSRCFDFKQPWVERKCGRTRSLSHYMAGCYEHSCRNGTLFIAVHNSSLYPCYYAGQHVHIKKITDGWLREGVIVCPACHELCSQCKTHEKTRLYIGDPDLDEPCSGSFLSIWISLCIVFGLLVKAV
uniref:Leishmanolysin-like peptidase n=1 Tax=Angiostrongylus cantonensis TaxID=6313 RepID=A0A158P6U1_ANGCA